MSERDDARQEVYDREGLIASLRVLGGVDLEVRRGVGFGAPERVVKRVKEGHASGQYIGGSDARWEMDGRAR